MEKEQDIKEQALNCEKLGFEETIGFIEAALAEGAHSKVPKRFTKEPWMWKRNLDATLIYSLNPDIDLERTGRLFNYETYNHGREWTRQTRNATMWDLWANSSAKTQSLFPFEELELNKPRPQRTKEIIVFSSRKESTSKNEELLDNLKKAKTNQEKQDILDQISYCFYLKHTKGDNPLLIPVKTLIIEAGYHVRRFQDYSLFHQAIKNKVPMAEIQRRAKVGSRKIVSFYHAILTEDKEEAKQALLKNESLKQFLIHPVLQVAGPPQKELPSTTQTKNRRCLRTFGRLLCTLLPINPGPQSKAVRDRLLTEENNFPVPIYLYCGRYYYPIEKEAELIDSVKQRLLVD